MRWLKCGDDEVAYNGFMALGIDGILFTTT